MPVEIWCELVCATCAKTLDGQYTREGRVPRKSLLRTAKAAGWIIHGEEILCSQRCLDKKLEPDHA